MNGQCPSRKVVYVTHGEARHIARATGLRGDPYKCPHCPYWHLTTTKLPSKRHRRAKWRVASSE